MAGPLRSDPRYRVSLCHADRSNDSCAAMNLFEAGVLCGIPTGAAIGGAVGKSHGVLGIVGGCLAGAVSGALAGWGYAFVVMFFVSVIGVLWRAARKRRDEVPNEADLHAMSRVAKPGVLVGVLGGVVVHFGFGPLHGLAVALVSAFLTAFAAVARCELRRGG
jgi:hypothetical protein